MRTRTIETIIDRGFWALVLMMPVLAYLILCLHNTTDFVTVLSQFNVTDTNVIYTSLVSLFGSNGYLPFLDTTNDNVLLLYMAYFFCIELIHIIVDVLLFIPRICVGILDKSSKVGQI